ncbi:hypothetical protein BU24DRAFT_460556 [Aaosphaeria arxii CBS 175.79]|uniref:Uncharacterized protein n=1 Tax=Aaosphaeria arxii CBS 175.79 TaxID=1450172 RepID=A0A6A5XXR6_9PLEO|nr:uncharacterized protein BU24DRAFT_460556 [Aaosphaeria arxii CBS 175.79]KAF2017521.1 hypothetical protein BU24DRAFT_460556 [Aaosphaeria arxii CBS 175.79]
MSRCQLSLPILEEVRILVDEMHQIRAYVETTSTRIQYLEEFLEPCASDQISSIKRGLRDVHRGLERLSKSFRSRGVDEITKEVWQSYRRLRAMEEKVRQDRKRLTIHEMDEYSDGAISEGKSIEVIDSTQSPLGLVGPLYWNNDEVNEKFEFIDQLSSQQYRPIESDAPSCIVAKALPVIRGQGPVLLEHYTPRRRQHERGTNEHDEDSLSGRGIKGQDDESMGEPIPITKASPPAVQPPDTASEGLVDGPVNVTVVELKKGEKLIAEECGSSMVMPSKAAKITNGVFIPNGAGRSADTMISVDVMIEDRQPEIPSKSSREVRYSIIEEEGMEGVELFDPHHRRQGSASGQEVTSMIMTGRKDKNLFLPNLLYIKIHEVRVLKKWLANQKYLHKAANITRMEKMLHLLTLLQMGCRFESVAVFFSRTPKEVQESCLEVFEGLLEMHSETMLPGPDCARRFAYEHCWNITKKYEYYGGKEYFTWSYIEVLNVLVTLNIFIGRYRQYGELRLIGSILPWGDWVRLTGE